MIFLKKFNWQKIRINFRQLSFISILLFFLIMLLSYFWLVRKPLNHWQQQRKELVYLKQQFGLVYQNYLNQQLFVKSFEQFQRKYAQMIDIIERPFHLNAYLQLVTTILQQQQVTLINLKPDRQQRQKLWQVQLLHIQLQGSFVSLIHALLAILQLPYLTSIAEMQINSIHKENIQQHLQVQLMLEVYSKGAKSASRKGAKAL